MQATETSCSCEERYLTKLARRIFFQRILSYGCFSEITSLFFSEELVDHFNFISQAEERGSALLKPADFKETFQHTPCLSIHILFAVRTAVDNKAGQECPPDQLSD